MDDRQKRAISASLSAYVKKYPSQNKAAASLSGTSAATLSAILQGKWEQISDDMWKKISTQVGTVVSEGWQIVETTASQEMEYALRDAEEWKSVTWVVGEAGCGKTTTARLWEKEHKESFYVLCTEDMHRSDFVRAMSQRIGLKSEGMTIRETLGGIVRALVQMDSPLLLFDEADKLSERVFHYFIDLYNQLEDKCGIVFFSTSYIKRRMEMGLRYDKKGYNEIHSRIGRKFYELDRTSARDVYAVCVANGVSDKVKISEIVKDAEGYDFDLRRVKKSVHKSKLQKR